MIYSQSDLELNGQVSNDSYNPKGRCNDSDFYIPYTDNVPQTSMKYIRLNFHIMNNQKGSENFKDGEAQTFFKKMLKNANARLLENHKMNLPVGNNTENLNPKYQYVLTPNTNSREDDGFYFHYDDDLYYFINKGKNRNNYNKDVIQKYAVNNDHILNVFVMPHHPDSIRSKTYGGHGTGIALGSSIKIAGIFENGGPPWNFSTLFNHEVGHVMGLGHSWVRSDGCDDTPQHSNCFSNTGKAPCDGVASNNMMDYNNSQMAISPCQLGRIHKNISREKSLQRSLIIEDWCLFDKTQTITINDEVDWLGHMDVNKDVVIKKGATLSIFCRVSFARSARIIVEPGAKLILDDCRLHNACDDLWGGIEIQQAGDEKGEVVYLGNVQMENTPSLEEN